jgi:shikimate kinase|tara:strand:+ start:3229 stop:3909 length:681 start_codon:yes stop_codon:yes gene_type:complete
MISFEQLLNEGLYDKGIFKAFFLAGGPGSGKSFVTRDAFAGTGLKVINSDTHFERQLKQAGLSMSMPDSEMDQRDKIRAHAKALTSTQISAYLKGKLGLVIDGTGRDHGLIGVQNAMLKQIGYDTHMVFVNTSLEVALERNKLRERTVPEFIAKKNWTTVQSNIGRFQNMFGSMNFKVIDNNKSEKELVTQTLQIASKYVRQKLNTPIQSYTAKRWMAGERKSRRR